MPATEVTALANAAIARRLPAPQFAFDTVFPNAGGYVKVMEHARRQSLKPDVGPHVHGTTFRQWEVDALNRLFALAEADPDSRAVLANIIRFAEMKNSAAIHDTGYG